MENFDAKQAREIAKVATGGEVKDVLSLIKNEAAKGKYILHVSKPLLSNTIEILRSRGFDVVSEPSIAVQKDNLYYTIKW